MSTKTIYRAIHAGLFHLLSTLPPELRRTVTCDRGSEFALFAKVEEALEGAIFYFDDAASPW